MRFAVIGLDHRHIYHMVGRPSGSRRDLRRLRSGDKRPARARRVSRSAFPTLQGRRAASVLMDDPAIDRHRAAAIPSDRAAIAIEAMRHGKDVMVDKPGVTTIRSACDRRAGRAPRPDASSRSASPSASSCPSTIVAGKLIADGAIGRVIQTIGLGSAPAQPRDPPGLVLRRAMLMAAS